VTRARGPYGVRPHEPTAGAFDFSGAPGPRAARLLHRGGVPHRGGPGQTRVLDQAWEHIRCNSPVTNHRGPSSQRIGFAKSSGSGRTNRHRQTGRQSAADGDLSTRRRAPGPHDFALTGDAVGVRTMLSSAQASGWRESVEGSRRIRVSSRPIPARVPIPAAGFRRRALFSRAASRQLRASREPLAASDAVRSRRHDSIIPLHPGGGTSSSSDRACGIS